jgi:hypothetical protein
MPPASAGFGQCQVKRSAGLSDGMLMKKLPYHGFRFPAAIINCSVRW